VREEKKKVRKDAREKDHKERDKERVKTHGSALQDGFNVLLGKLAGIGVGDDGGEQLEARKDGGVGKATADEEKTHEKRSGQKVQIAA